MVVGFPGYIDKFQRFQSLHVKNYQLGSSLIYGTMEHIWNVVEG